MNYYPFHIGDYLSATRHLSWEEDAAFRRLLDTYYTTEKPLPADIQMTQALVRANAPLELQAVEVILKEFFTLTSAGWVNKRCEKEILKLKAASEKASSYWASIPRHLKAAMAARRRAAKLQAMPSWLTPEHILQIEAIYEEARRISLATGVPHDVDHEIPLQGGDVCGLHVPWNLRAVPASINRSKGTSYTRCQS